VGARKRADGVISLVHDQHRARGCVYPDSRRCIELCLVGNSVRIALALYSGSREGIDQAAADVDASDGVAEGRARRVVSTTAVNAAVRVDSLVRISHQQSSGNRADGDSGGERKPGVCAKAILEAGIQASQRAHNARAHVDFPYAAVPGVGNEKATGRRQKGDSLRDVERRITRGSIVGAGRASSGKRDDDARVEGDHSDGVTGVGR
jgi:hypothetical protein